MREATLEEKAWLAGFIDGEGWIGLTRQKCHKSKHKEYYHPVVSVVQCEGNGLDLFVDLYGGKLNIKSRGTDKWREASEWYCPPTQLSRLLFDILPYVRIKKRQAELLIEYLSLEPGRKGRHGISDELWEKRNSIYNKLKVLNCRGTEGVKLRLIS